MYSIPDRGFIGKNPVKWFRVLIWDFDVRVKAGNRGAARYEAWLEFNDAYPDVTFGNFCKQSQVVRVMNETAEIFKSNLKPGDKVVMHGCYEAGLDRYKGKVFTVKSEPWMLCGSEVIKLEGKAGGFATEFLRKVDTH